MKPLKKITLKHLKQNKKRTRVIIVGVILATLLLFSVGIGISTIRKYQINEALNYQGNIHVYFTDLSYDKLSTLKDNKDISDILITQNKEKLLINNYQLNIISTNLNLNEYITLATGAFPKKNNEIIISDNLSRDSNYKLNDYINNYKITGIYSKSKLNPSEYKGNNYSPNAYTKENINENYKTNFYLTYKSIFKAYKKIYKTAESLNLNYQNKDQEKTYDNTFINTPLLFNYGQNPDGKKEISMYLLLLILLLVLSIFSILAIYNTFAISLSERKKHFGTLISVGASQKQILKSILYEVKIISLISIPISFIISTALIKLILIILNKIMENNLTASLSFHPTFLIITLIFVLITIFVSALIPALEISKISPIQAIKKSKDFQIKKSKENYPKVKKIFNIEGELAYKNIKRNPGRFTISISSISISIIFFITISTVINHLMIDDYNHFSDFDIYFHINESDNSKDIIKDIKNSNYIDDIVIYRSEFLDYKRLDNYYTDEYKEIQNAYNKISIIGLDNQSYKKYQDKIKAPLNKTIIYNSMKVYDDKAEDYKLIEVFKDDNFTLEICDNNDCNLSFKENFITDIYPFKSSDFSIIVNETKYEDIVNNYLKYYESNIQGLDVPYDYYLLNKYQVGIYSKEYKLFDLEIQNILNKYINENIQYDNYSLSNHKEKIEKSGILFILYSFIIFIIVIAVSSILNTINTMMALREREFSIYRSIGLSKKGMLKMIKFENLFLGIKTLIYSIPTSIIIIEVISVLLKTLNDNNNTVSPFSYIIISFASVLIIIIITTRYSINKIKNKNIIDSIKKENT